MKTILVDDEIWMMRQFEIECSLIEEIEIVGKYTSSINAFKYATANPIEFALLDIEMPGMNGIELAKKLRELYPDIIIVFITGHKKYLEEFIYMKADYYVFKPYTVKDVEDVLKRAKLLSKRFDKRIFIRTFGNFEVFVEGKPIYFTSAKAKELLAYMVDRRGGILNSKEAFSTIWENRGIYSKKNSALFRKTLMRLRENLDKAGIEDLIVGGPRGKMLNTELFDCDLYAFLDGRKDVPSSFSGEYMSQYSWGELTLANLLNIYENNLLF